MIQPKIDVHCHLFNKDILTFRIWLEIIHELEELVVYENNNEAISNLEKIKEMIRNIKRIINFLKIGWKNSPIVLYKTLQEGYMESQGEKYIVVPLTLDMKYIFAEPHTQPDTLQEQYKNEDEALGKEVNRLVNLLENEVIELGDIAKQELHKNSSHLFDKKESRFYNEQISEMEKLFNIHSEFKTIIDKFWEVPDNITKSQHVLRRVSSYEIQIDQLLELSNNPRYGSNVMPFLSIDPRRADTKENAEEYLKLIKRNVGKDKGFMGITLYCPLGYSPTDPFLYGSEHGNDSEECLYKFCEDNKIPITVHCSDTGFATFAQQVVVTGYIKDNEGEGAVNYVENKIIDFGSPVLGAPNKKEAIRKRSRTLNHPSLWRKVYERYEDIYLNFAHFGGADTRGDWRPELCKILKSYPNAFADLSCFTDAARLKEVKEIFFDLDNTLKSKFLFGSGYYLVMLNQAQFSNYIEVFRSLFSKEDFEKISVENPRKFMQFVIPNIDTYPGMDINGMSAN